MLSSGLLANHGLNRTDAMISLRKPSPEVIRAFLERQSSAEFSYCELGCTRGAAPASIRGGREGMIKRHAPHHLRFGNQRS